MDKLLTTKEASEILKVSPATVQTWLRKGRLKGIKIPEKAKGNRRERRKWRIHKSVIDEFLYYRGKPPW
jgi:excisionase family DNA binding protein